MFEPGGVTPSGSPGGTTAAERVPCRRGLQVLEWGVAPNIADRLNAALGAAFVGLASGDDIVDRSAQRRRSEP